MSASMRISADSSARASQPAAPSGGPQHPALWLCTGEEGQPAAAPCVNDLPGMPWVLGVRAPRV